MQRCYIIVCRDDTGYDGNSGKYLLATRITFKTHEDADAYTSEIACGREAIVVECPNGLLIPGPMGDDSEDWS